MDEVDARAAELVAGLERMLERAVADESGPVAVRLEVWAAWHGL